MATTATTVTNGTKATLPPKRMGIANVLRVATAKPHRVVCYGTEGIGKTTFGALSPKPVFIGTEDGAGALTIDRFPKPERWDDILEAIQVLTVEPHGFESVVVDSLDWMEPLIWSFLCERDAKTSIESFGFGKGYIEALSEGRRFLSALETLQAKRNLNVIILAHAHLKMQKNPNGEDFERYTLKVHEKLGGAVREWAETVLFANWETFTKLNDSDRRVGISTGRRILHTTKQAAFEAKNRYALPDELDLTWDAFAKAVERNRNAENDIRALLKEEPDRLKKFEAWLPRPIHELVQMRDQLAMVAASTPSNESNESNKKDGSK